MQYCTYCGATVSGDATSLGLNDTLDGAKTISNDAIRPEKVLAGRYRIIKQLGSGGMGEVYLASDAEMNDMSVAIKVLPPVLARNKRSIEALKREAAVSLRLSHANICRLHSFNSDGEIKFLVMEYIEGQTLEEMLDARDDRKLPLEELLPIVGGIADALDYAHGRDPAILHRDIKPSNIMISEDGAAKLLDFGIARELKDSMTRVTGKETAGTLLYMSPEQFSGDAPSPAGDIYALGATIYECLSGQPPFHRGAIGHQLLNTQPPELPGQPPHVNAALQKALAKLPAARPTSAEALVAVLSQAPVRSAPSAPSEPDAPGKPDRRPRRKLGVLMGVLVLLGIALAVRLSMNHQPPPKAPLTPESVGKPDDSISSQDAEKFSHTRDLIAQAQTQFDARNYQQAKSLLDQAAGMDVLTGRKRKSLQEFLARAESAASSQRLALENFRAGQQLLSSGDLTEAVKQLSAAASSPHLDNAVTSQARASLSQAESRLKARVIAPRSSVDEVVLHIVLPKAMFKGTPVPVNEPNIAKGRAKGEERPAIKVPQGTVNLALKKTVTSNEALPVVGDLEMVTDGDKSGEDGHNVDIGFGKKWVQIDLGLQANIYGISVWHYHGQARAYRDVIVEVADDEDFIQNVQVVFNSDHDNSYGKGPGKDMGYVETNEGRYIHCPQGSKGRYVRLHSQGNTSNDQNHYTEVEIYGIPVK